MSGQHTPWQIVVDGFGYPSIYETDEYGRPDDLVAHCFADHEHLICAAPEMFDVLRDLFENPQFQVGIGGNPNMVEALIERAHAALSKATPTGDSA